MSFDPTSLEADLRSLRPAPLDAALLARLEAGTSATWTELDPMEAKFEQELRAIKPAALSSALLDRLEASTRGTPFAVEKKIVRFPGSGAPGSSNQRGRWAAAAAVAITGALTALMIPSRQEPTHVIAAPLQAPPLSNKPNLIPAGFNRGLSQASDQGVVFQSGNEPHRVLKVVYTDRITLKDEQGKTYQVEQPRVEYILVPAKTD